MNHRIFKTLLETKAVYANHVSNCKEFNKRYGTDVADDILQKSQNELDMITDIIDKIGNTFPIAIKNFYIKYPRMHEKYLK